MFGPFITFITLAVSLFASAQTEGQPFDMPAGKYNFDCWSFSVEKTAVGELSRSSFHTTGVKTVSYERGTFVETYKWDGMDGEQTLRTTNRKRLDGSLEQQIESANSVGDAKKVKNTAWTLTVKIDKNVTVFVKQVRNQEAPTSIHSEFAWQKMEDGRIFAQNYQRETDSYKDSGGQQRDILVGNNSCLFTPVKK